MDVDTNLHSIISSFDKEATRFNNEMNAHGICRPSCAGLPLHQGLVKYATELKTAYLLLAKELLTCHEIADIMADKQEVKIDGTNEVLEFKTLDIDSVHGLLERIENIIGLEKEEEEDE